MKYGRLFAFLLLSTSASAALQIDGLANEAHWRDAHSFSDFVSVEPLSRAPADLSQRARMVSLPEGIAVHFDINHPPHIPRTKPATVRDKPYASDRVNFMIDFDGNGTLAYEFTVALGGGIEDGIVVNEKQFKTDWDAEWQYAVHETDAGWSVELLLPWSIAAMQRPEGDSRTVAVYFDRVLKSSGQRFAFPGASYMQNRFVSDFHRVTIPQYQATETRLFPYLSALSDEVSHTVKSRAGVDFFWKAGPDFQLSAALNPDFGQVESDDLIVDFSAIETFYSDKRPFFTENQAAFEMPTPEKGQLFYTRRIGNSRDDGQGVANIDAALKLNGSYGSVDFAYLGAQENDHGDGTGKLFNVLRSRWSDSDSSAGLLLTHTERPYRDRQARVAALDMDQRFDGGWRVAGQLLQSQIDEQQTQRRALGASATINYEASTSWQHSLQLLHFGRELDFNDAGYMPRADLNSLRYQTSISEDAPPANAFESGRLWYIGGLIQENDSGQRLPGEFWVQRNSQFRDGALATLKLIARPGGVDDLFSRGHGDWLRPDRGALFANYEAARRGDWQWALGLFASQEGLDGYFWELQPVIKYFASDVFDVNLSLNPRFSQDWLKWQSGDQFARYQRSQYDTALEANWFPADGHELRLQFQWLAVSAQAGERYRLIETAMHAEGTAAEPFTLNHLGLQLRYRYALAPLSDLYLVYSRGGVSERRSTDDNSGALFEDALQLRDSDQFFIKLRYRL